MLAQKGFIKKIIKKIPEDEFKEFYTILSLTYDDVLENERSLVSYLQIKSAGFEALLKNFALDERIQKIVEAEQ
jgi:hypothetical protein